MYRDDVMIKTVIKALKKFSEQNKVKEVISQLTKLNDKNPVDIKETDLADIRKNLNAILNNTKFSLARVGSEWLHDVVWKCLVLLAEFRPINDSDPVHLDSILPEDKLFTSTGYQFSLTALVHFHRVRPPRAALGETSCSNRIINPITNLPFSDRDSRHILDLCNKKGLQVSSLTRDESFFHHVDTTYPQTFFDRDFVGQTTAIDEFLKCAAYYCGY